MIGALARTGLAVLALVILLLALPRTATSPLAWLYPDAIFWHNTESREILLAIDDGPHPSTTPLILDALDRADVTAMFFVFGQQAEAHPNLIQEILERGHSVGAHMFQDEITALRPAEEVAQDLHRTLDALPNDGTVTLVRPGYGLPSGALIDAAAASDLTVFVGDIIPLDTWDFPSALYRNYLSLMVRSGSVITLHDKPEIGAKTAEEIPLIVSRLRDRGFAFVGWEDLRPAP